MAAELRWQTGGPAKSSGGDFLASGEESVETLLRGLIRRIEESERRYAEALDELHTRLGHVSQAASSAEALATEEESETLERLRLQLGGLARRLEQPEPERAQPLDKARQEVRAVSAGLAVAEPDWFQLRSSASAGCAVDADRASFLSAAEPKPAAHPLDLPFSGESDEDFDKRLIEMAQRLERSVGEAMPSTAIDSLNARMEEIAARFEAALAGTPKLENLQHLEQQVTDMGRQLGRVQQDVARIGVIEEQLHRLVARIEETPAEMERAAERGASKAAEATARLVAEASAGKPSAVERLDALRRDIVAMNERSLATDDRVVDTLAAMHESVKGLVQQKERERARAAVEPRPVPVGEALPVQAPASPATPQAAPAQRPSELPRRNPTFIRDVPFDSTEDLVAAARRAAQAAAARAERRDAFRRRSAAVAEESGRSGAEPGLHKMSLLMVVAAVLLMISAALLFTRLKSKPDLDAPAPAAEQTIPAPAHAPQPPYGTTPAPTGMDEAPPVRLGEAGEETGSRPTSIGSQGGNMLLPGVRLFVTGLN